MDLARPAVHQVNRAASSSTSPALLLGKEIAALKRVTFHEGDNPVLNLISLNGTFERKKISVPYYPATLLIGRQFNRETTPTPVNGFFDSKAVSKRHAEIWADRNGKVWIRDTGSSNGTFVNGQRLSAEVRSSEPFELQTQDRLVFGTDLVSQEEVPVAFVQDRIEAKVEHAGYITTSFKIPSHL